MKIFSVSFVKKCTLFIYIFTKKTASADQNFQQRD